MRWATPRRSGSDLIKQSRICLIVAILKSLVSALSVARGASDERERPIVHLGATFGSGSGLATRSRQSRASFCPAFRSVLACLATGIDWFEDRFDAIAGDYDTATSGDAAGRTKRVGRLLRPVNGSDRLPYRREDAGPLTRAARFARRSLAVPNRAIPAK